MLQDLQVNIFDDSQRLEQNTKYNNIWGIPIFRRPGLLVLTHLLMIWFIAITIDGTDRRICMCYEM